MGEQPVRIFIIKYGRSTHWKVLLTTDTSMNFVRAFELYERRWGIEVIFKECRGYLGLGKCQSRSYNAQIADTTLCFMMYQMLSLAKRFSEYETLGALFRSERDRLQVLTLWSRTLEEVKRLWKFCRVKQEWFCWHVCQQQPHGRRQISPQRSGHIFCAIRMIMPCPIWTKHFLGVR
ncbi:MAG: transposase [Bacteroides sp.]|nr:transposase [Bacteroides sp.]